MDKKELNRNYGEFEGWGTAYRQFDTIFGKKNAMGVSGYCRCAGDRSESETVRRSARGYSHIDTLKKLRYQNLKRSGLIQQREIQTQTEDLEAKANEKAAEVLESQVVGGEV